MKKELISGCLLAFPALLCAEQTRPNIIWISSEDMSQHLGCYGEAVAKTPNLDRLAERGTRYDAAYTTCAISAPVRAGIITGMYQTTVGGHHMRTTSYLNDAFTQAGYEMVPPHYVKTFTEYLRASGYYCTNNNKTDYQMEETVTMWNECSTNAHWRNRPDKDMPFFAVFNFNGTHESQTWRIDDVKTDWRKVEVPPYYPDTEKVRRTIAKQQDNINRMDTWAGNLMAQLEEDGVADNTVIFFWGDHGDGFPRGKRWLYDSGTHVPLITYVPGQKGGQINDQLISSIDFGATVLSLAGVQIPSHMQGQAFLGDQTGEPRAYVAAARDREDENYDMLRSIRDDRFLYIRNFYPNQAYVGMVPYRNNSAIMQELHRLRLAGELNEVQMLWMNPGPRPDEELYDYKKDPHNIHNLALDPKYKEVLERMRAMQTQWGEETHDLGLEVEAQMRERFWPGGVQPKTAVPVLTYQDETVRYKSFNPAGSVYVGSEYTLKGSVVEVGLHHPTQGASMVYTFEKGDNAFWQLYTGPMQLTPGDYVLRVRSARYGWKPAPDQSFVIHVVE